MNEKTTDNLTYTWTGLVLRAGFYISFGLMLAGLIWWLVAGMPGSVQGAEGLVPIDKTFAELGAGNPLALLDVGVLALLATPVLTILTVMLSFAAARNWRFAALAALILAILLLSIAISLKWIVL